jgi:hypothetical protein
MRLPFADELFDGVVASHVLNSGDRCMMDEIFRVLKRGILYRYLTGVSCYLYAVQAAVPVLGFSMTPRTSGDRTRQSLLGCSDVSGRVVGAVIGVRGVSAVPWPPRAWLTRDAAALERGVVDVQVRGVWNCKRQCSRGLLGADNDCFRASLN